MTIPPLSTLTCFKTITSSSKMSLAEVDCWPDVYQPSMFRFMYIRVKGDFFEKRMSAISGFGYVPHSDCTNDLGGAQIPSAWPSAHLSGMVSSEAAEAGSSFLGAGASGAAAAEAGGAAGSFEGPPPDEAPPHAAARMTIAG